MAQEPVTSSPVRKEIPAAVTKDGSEDWEADAHETKHSSANDPPKSAVVGDAFLTSSNTMCQLTSHPSISPHFDTSQGGTRDLHLRSQPTPQQILEFQLIELAEMDLGVANAVWLLERKLLPENAGSRQREIKTLGYWFGNCSESNFHSSIVANERYWSKQLLLNLAYQIGLRKAVEILQNAVDDNDSDDVTYKIITVLPPPPQPLMPIHGPTFLPEDSHKDCKENLKPRIGDEGNN